jgi:DNA-directed RNA polymerase specialized sigma subunit
MLKLASQAQLLQATSVQLLSLSEVADRLGESENRLVNAIRIARECRTTSLDKPSDAMSEGANLMDLIRDERVSHTPKDDYKWLHEQVQALDFRERDLLQLRYGEENNRSYSEVAGCMGMTKACAKSLERRALGKLRRRLTPVLNPCMS